MILTIQILLIILLAVGIVAVLRFYFVLGDVRHTLEGVDETRKELNSTVKRLNTLISEEITPTLQATRVTMDNLESSTRAISQATQFIRAISGRTESRIGRDSTPHSIAPPIASFVAQQGTKLAIGLITTAGAGVISGIRSFFGRKKQLALSAAEKSRYSKKMLAPDGDDQLVPIEDPPHK